MFFYSEKRFEIYKKKQYFQDILTIFLIIFLHFSRHFKIMYVLLNIQSQLEKTRNKYPWVLFQNMKI